MSLINGVLKYYTPCAFTSILLNKEKKSSELEKNMFDYLTCIIRLLQDIEEPFPRGSALEAQYENFMKSSDNKLLIRQLTVSAIAANASKFHKENNKETIKRIFKILKYAKENREILYQAPNLLGIEPDFDAAIAQAIQDKSFDFDKPSNEARLCWDEILVQIEEKKSTRQL